MNATLLTALAWAAQDTEGKQPLPLFPTEMMIAVAVIIFLYIFLLGRPRASQTKEREKLINELERGDEVVTAGGIHGTVEGQEKDNGIVIVNVAPKINMRFNRTSIADVVSKKNKGRKTKEEEKAAR
jgi:preprotein translocase subunit YajC